VTDPNTFAPATRGDGFCKHCRKPLPTGPQPHHVIVNGKSFFTQFCSDACREAYFRTEIKEGEKQRRTANPDLRKAGPILPNEIVEKNHTLLKQINDQKVRLFLCESCGNIFFQNDKRERKFCSSKCRDTYHNARRPWVKDPLLISKTCAYCGAAMNARAGAKYCSTRCRKAASRARGKIE